MEEREEERVCVLQKGKGKIEKRQIFYINVQCCAFSAEKTSTKIADSSIYLNTTNKNYVNRNLLYIVMLLGC